MEEGEEAVAVGIEEEEEVVVVKEEVTASGCLTLKPELGR